MSGIHTPAQMAVSLARRLGLDSNPLRRGTDRAEAWLRVGLVMAFLAGGPLMAWGVGRWAEAVTLASARAQAAAEQQVPATLVHNVPGTYSPHSIFSITSAPARWTAPDGSTRTGEVAAPLGARAGSTVPIWTDRSGQLAEPPLTRSQIAGRAVAAAVVAVMAFGLLLAVASKVVHRVLERRRMASWENAWTAVEPLWTRRPR